MQEIYKNDTNDQAKKATKELGPKVINIHTEPKSLHVFGTLYIGRSDKNHLHFGNPFSHVASSKGAIRVSTRTEAITEFEKWIIGIDHKHLEQDRRHWMIKHLWKIKQAKCLACFCAPFPCHGDILKKLALNPNTKFH